MRPHPRRAATDPSSPQAWGTDDRSGFVGNHRDLMWQFEWAGTQLVNKRILVYEDMYDEPQRQLGTVILPPDPVPIQNARPETYPIDELWPMLMELSTVPNDAVPIFFEQSTLSTLNRSMALSLETSTEP